MEWINLRRFTIVVLQWALTPLCTPLDMTPNMLLSFVLNQTDKRTIVINVETIWRQKIGTSINISVGILGSVETIFNPELYENTKKKTLFFFVFKI